MPTWEFCKIEPRTIGPADSGDEKGKRRPDTRLSDRRFVFRMTAHLFTPDGLRVLDEGDEYQGYRDDNSVHKEMSEQMLAKLGQQGWEPFFTDTRSSQNYFIWHLKRMVPDK